jgi:signal peptidase I
VLTFLVAAAAIVALPAQVVSPMRVESTSMEPTLDPGDQLVVDRLSRHFRAPQPGDVKRVVAEAGQRVAIEDGVLAVDGVQRDEPYADLSGVDAFFFGPRTVPDETVFVLGDNRGESYDSADYGPVPVDRVVARVLWHS